MRGEGEGLEIGQHVRLPELSENDNFGGLKKACRNKS